MEKDNQSNFYSQKKQKSKYRRKKSIEEIQILAAAGMVAGFVDQYIGNVIVNIFEKEDEVLKNNLFPEAYITGMVTGAIIGVYNDLPPYALTLLATGFYFTFIQALKLYIGRETISDEQLVRDFIFDSTLVFFLLRLQNFYANIFKNMPGFKNMCRPKKKDDNKPITFTGRLQETLTSSFIVTVYYAFRQRLRNIQLQEQRQEENNSNTKV